MSNYNASHDELKEEKLRDLVRRLKATNKEIIPLENYKKEITSEIKETMTDLNIKDFEGIRLETKTKRLVSLDKLIEHGEAIIPYAILEMDVQKTTSNMYQNHIDFGVAKKMIASVIDKSKYSEVNTIEIKGRF